MTIERTVGNEILVRRPFEVFRVVRVTAVSEKDGLTMVELSDGDRFDASQLKAYRFVSPRDSEPPRQPLTERRQSAG